MVNKNTTHRLMIQISVKQYQWLKAKSEQLEISISQLVRWLLNKKIKDVTDIKRLETKPKETIEKDNSEDDIKSWDELIKEAEEINKKED